MNWLGDIGERKFYAEFFLAFKTLPDVPTIQWARENRIITNKETSQKVGSFDANVTPYMEYVYDCLDNPYIPMIASRKSARVAWTETINNYRGKRIDRKPTSMLLGFPTKEAARDFAKQKLKVFFENTLCLRTKVNFGIAENKKSLFEYSFENGSLKLATLGSIANQKSNNYEYIEIEEPDDAKDDVNNQGDTFANLKERQKLVPITRKKFIFGGTPTFKDFSRVDKAIEQSNYMEFKACCHNCNELVSLAGESFDHIHVSEYQDGSIDVKYGKYDPESAIFICPFCKVTWGFEQKNLNIIEGKKYGFIDHTGNHSKGWHARYPEKTEIFGFVFSELMSPFIESRYSELMRSKLEADVELSKGNEKLLKSYTNNKRGMSFASGVTSMEVEEMKRFRLSYEENVCPMEGLILTCGIDVQDNRFAISIRAWGRDGRSFGITWKEIYGTVLDEGDDVWDRLAEETVLKQIHHAGGKMMQIARISIDSSDNTELVYKWVLRMEELRPELVFACKGVKELRHSEDEVYKEPPLFTIDTNNQRRKSLAETMGITVYNIGAHRAHLEILQKIMLLKNPKAHKNKFHFPEYSYGQYEEQMLSCRQIIDGRSKKEVFKLIPGKRKEAMDTEKMAYWCMVSLGLRDATPEYWEELEAHYH